MAGPYSPEQAILTTRLQNEDASRLTVVFPPWHGGGQYVERLTSRLAASGSAVLDFDFHDRILEPDINRVLQSYGYIRDAATEKIQQLFQGNGYEELRLISMSLGTVALALVANELPSFTEAAIVAGSSNLSMSVWEGIKTQHIMKQFMRDGTSADDLDAAWLGLAPKSYAPAFEDKEVKIRVASKDTVIPSVYQRELLAKLEEAGANTHPNHLRLGHYATLASYYYFGK